METLRILVSIPLLIADAIYARLTYDAEEQFFREQEAKFQRWAEGE